MLLARVEAKDGPVVWRETGVDGAHGLSTSEVEEMTHLRETSDCPGHSRPPEPPAGQRESPTQATHTRSGRRIAAMSVVPASRAAA